MHKKMQSVGDGSMINDQCDPYHIVLLALAKGNRKLVRTNRKQIERNRTKSNAAQTKRNETKRNERSNEEQMAHPHLLLTPNDACV